MKDYFTVNELAEHFGVDPKTIYRRLWAKEIRAYKVGQQWRIARKVIIWLKKYGIFLRSFVQPCPKISLAL